MIKGLHVTFFSPEAEAARAFLRDTLGLSFYDAGDGWLIFQVPEGELGFHPSDETRHELSFYCDDIHETVSQLTERGVTFTKPITDEGWGLSTRFLIPGDVEVDLYQPVYTK